MPLCCTEDDIIAIARKLAEQAREGDRTSARLVLKYALGDAIKPAKSKQTDAAKPATHKRDFESVAFVSDVAKVLRALDAQEAAERRQAAAAARPGGPPPGTARR